MKSIKIILCLGLILLICSCGGREPYSEKAKMESTSSDSASNSFISSSAAVENKNDTSRKFIRTADLKFKVKSVIKSTYDIENIAKRQGGFVTYTNLTSEINDVTNTAVSEDSSLETTYFTVINSISLRIPNIKLDTTLKEISKSIDFLDYRIIKADDVALQILSNNLIQKRSAKNEERLTDAIDSRGKKLKETAIAEEILLSKQEQADNAKISNLSLTDQINFSTINLSIYQRKDIKRELISNDKNIDEYEPSFGSKMLEAIKLGWNILETIFITLTKLWGLILIALIVFFVIKKMGLLK